MGNKTIAILLLKYLFTGYTVYAVRMVSLLSYRAS